MSIELAEGRSLGGTLTIPEDARGAVLFAHGSGSSRFSPRNRAVASALNRAGFAAVLMDLLTEEEEEEEKYTRHLRFDIELLAERLGASIEQLRRELSLPFGLFGASTGAAAALIAAARDPENVSAVVSRGGRPDLAQDSLPLVRAPTLLIVGGLDTEVLQLNESAAKKMRAPAQIEVVPGASHLFEEPGTLDRVAELAKEWFATHLATP